MRRIIPYIIIGLLLLAFYVWRYRIPPTIEPLGIRVQTENGLVEVTDLHEGPILLNFYASWCGPCMREIPDLNNAHQKGLFTVVGVTDDDPAILAKTIERYGIEYPAYRLESSIKDYGVYTIPTTYLINEKGEVVESMTDPRDWDSEEFMNKAASWLSKEGY